MNSIPRRHHVLSLFWILILALMLFGGCDSSSTTGSGQVGSAVFRLEIKQPAAAAAPEQIQSASASSGNPIDCTAHSIEAVNCKIYDAEGTIITEETFACSLHEGRIENIPAGEDRNIVIDAVSEDNIVLYRGEKKSFQVPAWETADLGTIELSWMDFTQADFEGTWYGHGLYTGELHAWTYSTSILDASGNGEMTYYHPNSAPQSRATNPMKISKQGTITSPEKKSIHGAMTIDKNIMAITDTKPEEADGNYILIIQVKTGGNFSQSDLEGTWYGHSLISGIYPGWEYSTLTIDGSGNSTLSSVESDGTEDIDQNPGRLSINGDGILTLSNNSSLHGVMSADKNILVATATGDDQEEYFLHIFVKGGGDFADMRWANTKWQGHGLFSGSNENWLYDYEAYDDAGTLTIHYFLSDGYSNSYIEELDNFSSEGILISPSTAGHGVVSIDKNMMAYTDTYGEFNDNFFLGIYIRQPDKDAWFHPVYRSSIYPRIDYFADGRPTDYYMLASAVTTAPDYEVRITNVPDASEDIELIYHTGWSDFYPFLFARAFTPANGYPEPGPAFEGIEYTFYIDINGNGSMDSGEPTDSFKNPDDIITELGRVQQVTISQGKTPTITWEGIDTAADLNYRIMLFPADNAGGLIRGDLLFVSEYIAPDTTGSFSFTYNGSLFEENETLYIGIDAIKTANDTIINQSRYFQRHDSL